jgi:Kef-type K+ transport system membrane component KefB
MSIVDIFFIKNGNWVFLKYKSIMVKHNHVDPHGVINSWQTKKGGRISMMNIYLFLAIILLLTFLIGRLVEKARVPWIFAALLIGLSLAIYNPLPSCTSSETFTFLAQLGMYSLLFMVGFELDIKELQKLGRFIIKATFFIICLEAFFGTFLVHFVFGCSWTISCLVAMSFATVGEAILLPILDEFKIINTRLGQSIIGSDLYSVVIASSMAFKFIVPVLFANLLVRWNVAGEPKESP